MATVHAAELQLGIDLYDFSESGKWQDVKKIVTANPGPAVINLQDGNGRSSLMQATSRGNEKCVVELLKSKDIDVNLKDYFGKTALIMASDDGNEKCVVELLKSKDIDVNLKDSDGDTALSLAKEDGNKECVKLLMAFAEKEAKEMRIKAEKEAEEMRIKAEKEAEEMQIKAEKEAEEIRKETKTREQKEKDFTAWLCSVKPAFNVYTANFMKEGFECVNDLEGVDGVSDLKEIGILKLKHRKDLWTAIQKLRTAMQFPLRKRLEGHEDVVNCCCASFDGEFIVSGSGDNTLRIWDNQGIHLKTLTGHEGSVCCCAISRDNSFIASGSSDETLRLWDRESGECFKVLEGHGDYVLSCDIFENLILSASRDWSLKLWNKKGEELRTFRGHSGGVYCGRFSSTGRIFASAGSQDKSVRVWEIGDSSSIKKLEGHTNYVQSCAWSSNDERLLSTGNDKTLRVWDVEQEDCLQVIKLASIGVSCMFLFADSHLLVGNHLYERKSGKEVAPALLKCHSKKVRGWAADGKQSFILTASEDKTLGIHDVPKEKQKIKSQ